MIVTEIYVEDNLIYSIPSVDNTSSYTPSLCEGGSYPSLAFDTDKYIYTKGSKTTMILQKNVELPTNCIIEADINAYGLGLCISDGLSAEGYVMWNTQHSAYRYTNGSWINGTSFYTNTPCRNVVCHLKLAKRGNSITVTLSNYSETVNYTKELQTDLNDKILYAGFMAASGLRIIG